MATSLMLTYRDDDFYEGLFQSDGETEVKPPRIKGRVVTTLHKAKEIRPLVEKCVTLAKKALPHIEAAEEFDTQADRNTDEWRQWRKSDQWAKWNAAMAPALAIRRRLFSILRDNEAVDLLLNEVAPRFVDRNGGYLRILRLATPRLGDNGAQAILEFVGVRDRVKTESARPSFVGASDQDASAQDASSTAPADNVANEDAIIDDAANEDVANDGGDTAGTEAVADGNDQDATASGDQENKS